MRRFPATWRTSGREMVFALVARRTSPAAFASWSSCGWLDYRVQSSTAGHCSALTIRTRRPSACPNQPGLLKASRSVSRAGVLKALAQALPDEVPPRWPASIRVQHRGAAACRDAQPRSVGRGPAVLPSSRPGHVRLRDCRPDCLASRSSGRFSPAALEQQQDHRRAQKRSG